MKLKYLEINYRTVDASFDFDDGINVITGSNGSWEHDLEVVLNSLATNTYEKISGLKIKFSENDYSTQTYENLQAEKDFLFYNLESHSNMDCIDLGKFLCELKEKAKEKQIIIMTFQKEVLNIADKIYRMVQYEDEYMALPKTIGYNDIDLFDSQKYQKVCTNTFWDKNTDVVSQLLTRYTKSGDTVLNLGFDFCIPDNIDRKVITGDNSEQKTIHFIITQTDHSISEDFDCKFAEHIKKVVNCLKQNRFLALFSGDRYFDGELHLYGFKYADILIQCGLKLKTIIVNEFNNLNENGRAYKLWKYRALTSGFNIINHRYIFIFEKI